MNERERGRVPVTMIRSDAVVVVHSAARRHVKARSDIRNGMLSRIEHRV